MIYYKEFDRMEVEEKVRFFEENKIDFIVKNTAEKVLFEKKDNKMLICFYNNDKSEWGVLNKFYGLGDYFIVDYKIINARGKYDESASLIPIKKLLSSDIVKYEQKEELKKGYLDKNN